MKNLYLKAIDGEEIVECSKEFFNQFLETSNFRKVTKSDRTLYFIKENVHIGEINLYAGDYFEVLD